MSASGFDRAKAWRGRWPREGDNTTAVTFSPPLCQRLAELADTMAMDAALAPNAAVLRCLAEGWVPVDTALWAVVFVAEAIGRRAQQTGYEKPARMLREIQEEIEGSVAVSAQARTRR